MKLTDVRPIWRRLLDKAFALLYFALGCVIFAATLFLWLLVPMFGFISLFPRHVFDNWDYFIFVIAGLCYVFPFMAWMEKAKGIGEWMQAAFSDGGKLWRGESDPDIAEILSDYGLWARRNIRQAPKLLKLVALAVFGAAVLIPVILWLSGRLHLSLR